MARSEALKEAAATQEPLETLPQYVFHNRATIYGPFGRCEIEGQLTGEQLPEKRFGRHVYIALNEVKMYCFEIRVGDKRRTLYPGHHFSASGGKKK